MGKLNVLIAGSNGMLGKDIAKVFVSKGLYNVHGINRTDNKQTDIQEHVCDLTDFKRARQIIKEINPDIIINCAANINLDLCESNKKYAYKINTKVSEIFASYKPLKTKYIYISTDSVFDGVAGNYKEHNRTNPLNYYAYTKLEGEKLALRKNQNTIVIRTNIYGFNIPKTNSLVEWALNNLQNKNKIFGFIDVCFNPVYTKQLGEVVYKLVRSNFKGLVNVGSGQYLSKYEFLIKIANEFNINKELIGKISVDTMDLKTKRPKNTTLNTETLDSIIDMNLDINAGIKSLYQDYICKTNNAR